MLFQFKMESNGLAPLPTATGRSIEKDHSFNMDAQDAQENQHGTLLHGRLTPAMIDYEYADVQNCKPAVSRKILCILCIHVNKTSTHA